MEKELIRKQSFFLCTEHFKSSSFVCTDMKFMECADFVDDFGMDSIMFISLIVKIEGHFGIVIPENMLSMENFRNIDSIAEIITDCIEEG